MARIPMILFIIFGFWVFFNPGMALYKTDVDFSWFLFWGMMSFFIYEVITTRGNKNGKH